MYFSVSLLYGDQKLDFNQIEEKLNQHAANPGQAQKASEKQPRERGLADISARARSNKHKSPWSKFNTEWLNKKRSNCPKGQENE